MLNQAPVITIDGPSGAGKGTVSQLVAEKLGWQLLDSGALYRLLALAVSHHGMSVEDVDALKVLAEHLDIQFEQKGDEKVEIILEGEVVTQAIRTEFVGNQAYARSRSRSARRLAVASACIRANARSCCRWSGHGDNCFS